MQQVLLWSIVRTSLQNSRFLEASAVWSDCSSCVCRLLVEMPFVTYRMALGAVIVQLHTLKSVDGRIWSSVSKKYVSLLA